MSTLMDLTRAMVMGMIGIQTVLSSVVDVPLTKVGHNYALNFTIDGGVYNNIVSAVIFPLLTMWTHDANFWMMVVVPVG